MTRAEQAKADKRILGILGIRDPRARIYRSTITELVIVSWFPLPLGKPEEDLGVLALAHNPNKFLGTPMSFALEEEYRAGQRGNTHPLSNRGTAPPADHNHPNCRCELRKKTKK